MVVDRALKIRPRRLIRHAPTDRREVAEAVGPHLLAGRERDEGLWRAAVLLPIGLVLVANLVDERKAGIPIMGALRLGQARKFRHERAVGVEALEGRDRADTEPI